MVWVTMVWNFSLILFDLCEPKDSREKKKMLEREREK